MLEKEYVLGACIDIDGETNFNLPPIHLEVIQKAARLNEILLMWKLKHRW